MKPIKLKISTKTQKYSIIIGSNLVSNISKISKNNSIDILINNAGIAHVGNIENTNSEDLDRLYNVNIKKGQLKN